jgi:sterol desaturase/sphingolipid hydroxylase (fatty acid hydroxylase superfamily)
LNIRTSLLLWLPLLLVVLVESAHCAWYGRKSALARLLTLEGTVALDGVFQLFYYVVLPGAYAFAACWTIPGLLLLASKQAFVVANFHGIAGTLGLGTGPAAVIAWLLLTDFARYLSHMALHKVPFLWTYHKVHHAVTDFNIIAGNRVSLAEVHCHMLFNLAVTGLLFGSRAPDVLFGVLLAANVINVMQHTGLPWDYGPLKYILVSPRHHRMHHSVHPSDLDRNFATLFSFWDYAFRTVSARYALQSSRADECALGLPDAQETATIEGSVLRTLLRGTFAGLAMAAWRQRRRRSTDAEGLA